MTTLLRIAAPLLLLAALATPARAQRPRPPGKPAAPVEISLHAPVGDERTARLTIRPRVDAATLTVEVRTGPAGVGGGPLWAGPAHAGQEVTIPVAVPGEGAVGRLSVTATLTFEDGSRQSIVRAFAPKPDPLARGFMAALPAADVVTGPAGRRVVEVPSGSP